MKGPSPAERFAAATDALLRGELPAQPELFESDPVLAVAQRLHATATAGYPDPVFVAALRNELRARGTSSTATTLRYATVDLPETPLGTLVVAYRHGRVVFCDRFTSSEQAERRIAATFGEVPLRDDAFPERLREALSAHFAGTKRFSGVDLSWLPEFQRRVLEQTAKIPRGQVRPYGWIAREIGSPGAVRAVGTALGHNPIPFIVPCHRVVRSDGSLGEYSGGGPAVKAQVLEAEGVPVERLMAAARRGERYLGCRTTHIVCFPTCSSGRRARPENLIPFGSLAQAATAGYRPCLMCRPA